MCTVLKIDKMIVFLLSVIALATADAVNFHSYYPASASEAQIRFAIENKYDDTGPGAKKSEYAYNTYKTIDEAILGYLEDPDTKLPRHERDRALKKLLNQEPSEYQQPNLMRYYPKTVEEYTGYTPPVREEPVTERVAEPQRVVYPFGEAMRPVERLPVELAPARRQPSFIITRFPPKKYYPGSHKIFGESVAEPYRLQKLNQVKGNPVNVAHYTRDHEAVIDAKHSPPKYSFSYGVHAPGTGDSKSAQETRNGDSVTGYYTFVDADGKQRTVHYTADDLHGFRAEVERMEHML